MFDECLFAVGKGNLVSTDNDYFHWWDHDRNRANSFKTTGQGKVFDDDGYEYHYNLVSKYVWKQDTDLSHGAFFVYFHKTDFDPVILPSASPGRIASTGFPDALFNRS